MLVLLQKVESVVQTLLKLQELLYKVNVNKEIKRLKEIKKIINLKDHFYVRFI